MLSLKIKATAAKPQFLLSSRCLEVILNLETASLSNILNSRTGIELKRSLDFKFFYLVWKKLFFM